MKMRQFHSAVLSLLVLTIPATVFAQDIVWTTQWQTDFVTVTGSPPTIPTSQVRPPPPPPPPPPPSFPSAAAPATTSILLAPVPATTSIPSVEPASSSSADNVEPPTHKLAIQVPLRQTTCDSNQQQIVLNNQAGKELVIQAGPPWTVGDCGTIQDQTSCTFCQARGETGGNLQLGYGVANTRSTLIEGNWDLGAVDPSLDVSFILGYTVSVLCTNSAGAQTGYSGALCNDISCSNCEPGGGRWDGSSCQNPAGDPFTTLVNGPSPPFFNATCGQAYCYPNDSKVGFAPEWNNVTCVASTPVIQKQKRDAEPQTGLVAVGMEERNAEPEHGHTKHRHKKHGHNKRHKKHGHEGGPKVPFRCHFEWDGPGCL